MVREAWLQAGLAKLPNSLLWTRSRAIVFECSTIGNRTHTMSAFVPASVEQAGKPGNCLTIIDTEGKVDFESH